MTDSFLELGWHSRAHARVSCGCDFVLATGEAIEVREGLFLAEHTLVVVPCSDEHRETAKDAASIAVGKPVTASLMHEVAAEMETRVA